MPRSDYLLRSCSTSLPYIRGMFWHQQAAKHRKSCALFQELPCNDKMTQMHFVNGIVFSSAHQDNLWSTTFSNVKFSYTLRQMMADIFNHGHTSIGCFTRIIILVAFFNCGNSHWWFDVCRRIFTLIWS
mmetsp:Transcript_26138/g.67810  ORF Transcript_26138/g.67810 Transcript_26138/m.67810 type:complete len:129 (+) Transcript_26138:1265-1651(+)